MFCEAYFRFIINKGQKALLALLIFRKMSWPPPLKILKPNLSLKSGKMPFQWYPHFYLACADICLTLVLTAPGEAVQLCWSTPDNRDPAPRLVLQNWPQPVLCKREENQGKILENDLRRQFPKTWSAAEELIEYFEYLLCPVPLISTTYQCTSLKI